MGENVRVERRGAVLEIMLDRPKVNAIDHATSRQLGLAFAQLRDDPDLRVAVLTGAGERVFSAGWDLKALESGEQQLDNWWESEAEVPGGFAGITEMWDLNKPVIAALNGLAIGGGFEIESSIPKSPARSPTPAAADPASFCRCRRSIPTLT